MKLSLSVRIAEAPCKTRLTVPFRDLVKLAAENGMPLSALNLLRLMAPPVPPGFSWRISTSATRGIARSSTRLGNVKRVYWPRSAS